MLYSGLDSYATLLGSLAEMEEEQRASSADQTHSVTARKNIEHALAIEKKEIEGHLGSRFKIL